MNAHAPKPIFNSCYRQPHKPVIDANYARYVVQKSHYLLLEKSRIDFCDRLGVDYIATVRFYNIVEWLDRVYKYPNDCIGHSDR
jgi:hypothetical protein